MKRKRPVLRWCCNSCRTNFCLDRNQFIRYRAAESEGSLGAKKFFCRVCREDGLAEYKKDLFKDHGRFTQANLDAFWSKVADPTYYTGLRYGVATPLSYRERGVKIARSTKARA